jgi:hypothetical protein
MLNKKLHVNSDVLYISPAYPYTARDFFRELRIKLSKERQEQMSYEYLSRIVGRPKSTVHQWFEIYSHPHIVSLMCLLEYLPPAQRHAFIDAHCRILPDLTHAWLAHSPSSVALIWDILNQKNGLTIVAGCTDYERTFVTHAMGHAYRRLHRHSPTAAGIDFHAPVDFVPVDGFFYVNGTGNQNDVSQMARNVWVRLATSKARLLFLNGLWSSAVSLRKDVLRRASKCNIIVAEAGIPDSATLEHDTPVRLLTLTVSKRFPGRIQIRHKRIR